MSLSTPNQESAARAAIAALQDARDALDGHYGWCDRAHNGDHNELGIEARKRVGQLILLIELVLELLTEGEELASVFQAPPAAEDEASLEAWAASKNTPEVRTAVKKHGAVRDKLELLTETFYWSAWRARCAIRTLPGMKKFEAPGVLNVRNHLLEHPEKGDSGVLITSFGWGAPQGPVLKAIRPASQSSRWPDPGLFVNSDEFAKNLKARAEAVVALGDVGGG